MDSSIILNTYQEDDRTFNYNSELVPRLKKQESMKYDLKVELLSTNTSFKNLKDNFQITI